MDEQRSSLQRRRDELAAQVAELHWDLGGLAYEMALRDHFRLDVLVRRAAALQEHDAELADLERLLALEADAQVQVPAGRTLPGPGVAVLLVLLMLGFGVLTGNVARGSSARVVAHRGPLKLMMPGAAGAGANADATLPGADPVQPPPAVSEPEPPPAEKPEASTGSVTSGSTDSGAGAGSAAGSGSGQQSSGQAGSSAKPTTSTTPAAKGKLALPPIKHVFLIVLADQPYASTFGPTSAAPYLSGTLEHQGELLVRYYGVARDELANEIALVSGLGPTADTAANCPTFLDVTPAISGKDGQYSGNGCVYPSTVQTVGDQLLAKKLSWRVYAQDMEAAPPGEAKSCRHPAFGSADATAQARTGDAFATYRDPFSYFDSVIDSSDCGRDDVGIASLATDLAHVRRTPNLSYIVPNLCDDGREAPCVPGAGAGLPQADAFLHRVVPEILASQAYKQGGLLVITTDQAPASGPAADSSSCCSQPSFPGIPGNQPTAQAPVSSGKLPAPGGGQVGALLLSPYVKPHTFDQEPFNHFSLLRTIEDLFGLSHLGYAGLSGVSSFDATVFSRYQAG
jgi:phosphatidylinositol-3-phosphatase